MKQRVAAIIAAAILASLLCAPLALADELDKDSTQTLGIVIGICIIVVSMLGLRFSGRYFARKRQANARKNRARAKQKSKKKK